MASALGLCHRLDCMTQTPDCRRSQQWLQHRAVKQPAHGARSFQAMEHSPFTHLLCKETDSRVISFNTPFINFICCPCSLEHPSWIVSHTQPPAFLSCGHAPAGNMHFSALDSTEPVAGRRGKRASVLPCTLATKHD